MKIGIVIDPPKSVRPKNAIRADVAWKLFFPESMGDLPGEPNKNVDRLGSWLDEELLIRSETSDINSIVWILTPPLSDRALGFISTICSRWADSVMGYENPKSINDLDNEGKGIWKPPVRDIHRLSTTQEGGFYSAFAEFEQKGDLNSSVRLVTPHVRFYNSGNLKENQGVLPNSEGRTIFILKGSGTVSYGSRSFDFKQFDIVYLPHSSGMPVSIRSSKGYESEILVFD